LLAAYTNEDPATPNQILLVYIQNITLLSIDPPKSRISYKIGDAGLYFVNGMMNDPTNPYLAYLFTTDKNIASGTFGVFKMDFNSTSLKYVYTTFTMSSGF
jgi:hypothetical protein